jgi:hypothetical protein
VGAPFNIYLEIDGIGKVKYVLGERLDIAKIEAARIAKSRGYKYSGILSVLQKLNHELTCLEKSAGSTPDCKSNTDDA